MHSPRNYTGLKSRKTNLFKTASLIFLTLGLAANIVFAAELSMEDFNALHEYRQRLVEAKADAVETRAASPRISSKSETAAWMWTPFLINE